MPAYAALRPLPQKIRTRPTEDAINIKSKILNTKYAVVFILLFLVSCTKPFSKPLTFEERITSHSPQIVFGALAELWRIKDSTNIVPVISLLNDPVFMEYAAQALNLLNDQSVDKIVLSGLGTGEGSEGLLFYAYLAARDRYVSGETADFIMKNMDKFSGPGKVYGCMLLSFVDKKYISKAIDIMKKEKAGGGIYALPELLRLIGDKRYAPGYEFAAGIYNEWVSGEIPMLKEMAAWAMHRIRPVAGFKRDTKDKVIISNPYLIKYGDNPVWPAVPNSFKSWHTANPDIFADKNTVYMYYRAGNGTDRIALATVPYNIFNGKNFMDAPNNPIVDTSTNGFDSGAVLDPSVILFKGKMFLYYSGLGKGEDSIGLATSKDFYNFTKAEKPVLIGRAPEVVNKDGILYMFYVLMNGAGGYEIHLATSDNGYDFMPYGKGPIFEKEGEGAWDSMTVTTPRIFFYDGMYYMLYAGDDKYRDYPPYLGLAFSYDLIHWIRSTQNPIFSRGKQGTWEDGAIWYGDLFNYKEKWYLYYEGWGGGDSHTAEYGRGGRSQVGVATGDFDIKDLL